MLSDGEVLAQMRAMEEIGKRLRAEGYSVLVGGGSRARYRKGDDWRDAAGNPVGPDVAPVVPPRSLLDDAHEMVDAMEAPDLARFLMGERIDMATLDRLLDHMTMDQALREYTVPAIKHYLTSRGVDVGSEKREALVAMMGAAHTPED